MLVLAFGCGSDYFVSIDMFQNAEYVDREAITKFDPLAVDESQRMLEPPLRPLPAPMQPQILPSAKVACVRATCKLCFVRITELLHQLKS